MLLGVACVVVALCERAPDDLDARCHRLDSVIGACEQALVGGRGQVLPRAAELRQPEEVQVGLVADDHVTQSGNPGDDGSGPGREIDLIGSGIEELLPHLERGVSAFPRDITLGYFLRGPSRRFWLYSRVFGPSGLLRGYLFGASSGALREWLQSGR